MLNIINWIIYYLKCLFNIIYSYFNYKNVIIDYQEMNSSFRIIKLKGSYYQMGFQYGNKLKIILKKDVKKCYYFIKSNDNIFNKKINEQFRKSNIISSILNLYSVNKNNYNPNVINFMKGVSEGSNINYEELLIVNLFSDLMDNHCIILSKKIKDKILNLRTLDYGLPNLTQTLIILNPTNKNSYCSFNLSIIFGIFSGISKNGLFFGETYHDNNLGSISYTGMPFHHMAHNFLSSCENIKDGLEIMDKINRTSNLELLLGDRNESKIYLYSKDKLVEKKLYYNVTTKEEKEFHKNEQYLDSIENVINKFIPKTKSGELHCFIQYDGYLYISVTTDYFQSYNNNFYKLNIVELFI